MALQLAAELTEYYIFRKIDCEFIGFEIGKGIPLNIVKLTFDKKKKEVESFGSEVYAEYLSVIKQVYLKN